MHYYIKCCLLGVCLGLGRLGLGRLMYDIPFKTILNIIDDIKIYKAESQHYKTEIQNILDVDLSNVDVHTINTFTLFDKVNEYHAQRVSVMESIMNNLKDSELKDYDININQIIKSYMV